jgi:xylulokinase
MKNNLFAGLDVSTQSCKLVVIDLDKSNTVFITAINYDSDLPAYNTKNGAIKDLGVGVSESDPHMWLEAVDIIFERLKQSKVEIAAIKCIAVSGQQHGLVSLDENGNLTRERSKLWNDFDTLEECNILTKNTGGLEKMVEEVGNSQRTGYTAAKIFHMYRHEREAYDRTSTFFLVHNFINWYLTGGKKGGIRVMEPGDASGIALWNPENGQWSEKVLKAIDDGLKHKLPPIEPSDKSIGYISEELIKKYGFSEYCKIDAGSGDNMLGAIGTGNIKPGIVTISLGTSGTAYTVMENPYIDPTGEISAFCDSTGKYLPLLCVSNLANGYDEILNLYDISHEEFLNKIEESQPGNNGRILIPWFIGERTPDLPLAAPVYFGFLLADFKPEILCRAILEGHILSLYDGFERMDINPSEIRLTGGLSKSRAWRQCIADVFETEVVPVEGEGAAIGAALHAAWVWLKEEQGEDNLEAIVSAFVKTDEERRAKPDPEAVKIYRKQKKLYKALSKPFKTNETENVFELRSELINR